MSVETLTAEEIVARLSLTPHPEGGWYGETYRHVPAGGGRGASTAIYYLLAAGQRSHWHKVTDADEVWHWYAGAPLMLSVSAGDAGPIERHVLGNDVTAGACPQVVVPAGHWQAAESRGAWTLVGCTVAPAFQFESFVMAPEGWAPGDVS